MDFNTGGIMYIKKYIEHERILIYAGNFSCVFYFSIEE